MIVLDTNVISEMLRPVPDARVEAWLAKQTAEEIFLTAVSAAELQFGAAILPAGRRRDALATAIDAILHEDFARRILAFDQNAAVEYARIGARRRDLGNPISQFDCQIAAICRVEDATLATRNVRDFVECGVELIDPWQIQLRRL